jgi:hypothetical protein
MEDILDRVAAMLGHKFTLTRLAHYVGGTSRLRDLADTLKRATAARASASFHETTFGRCPTGAPHKALICREAPCLTTPMARWEPSTWGFAEYIEEGRPGKSATNGLLRSWSDLDRTGCLAAHLAALDRALDF